MPGLHRYAFFFCLILHPVSQLLHPSLLLLLHVSPKFCSLCHDKGAAVTGVRPHCPAWRWLRPLRPPSPMGQVQQRTGTTSGLNNTDNNSIHKEHFFLQQRSAKTRLNASDWVRNRVWGRCKEYRPIRSRKGRVFAGAAQWSRLAQFSLVYPCRCWNSATCKRNWSESWNVNLSVSLLSH